MVTSSPRFISWDDDDAGDASDPGRLQTSSLITVLPPVGSLGILTRMPPANNSPSLSFSLLNILRKHPRKRRPSSLDRRSDLTFLTLIYSWLNYSYYSSNFKGYLSHYLNKLHHLLDCFVSDLLENLPSVILEMTLCVHLSFLRVHSITCAPTHT